MDTARSTAKKLPRKKKLTGEPAVTTKHRLRSQERQDTERSKSEDTQAQVEFAAVVSSHETLNNLTEVSEPRLTMSTPGLGAVGDAGGGQDADEYDSDATENYVQPAEQGDDGADADSHFRFPPNQTQQRATLRDEGYDRLRRIEQQLAEVMSENRRMKEVSNRQYNAFSSQQELSKRALADAVAEVEARSAQSLRDATARAEAAEAAAADAMRRQDESSRRAIAEAEEAKAAAEQTLKLMGRALSASNKTASTLTSPDVKDEEAAHRQTGGRNKILTKPPTYDGTGDVERFIQRFDGVRKAQQYGEREAVLTLSICLKGKAEPCGSTKEDATVASVYANLRSRFGTLCTFSSVSSELRQMRWKLPQSIQDFAAQVQDTADKIDMPPKQYSVLTRDAFVTGLGHPHMAHYINSRDTVKEDLMTAVDLAKQYVQEYGPVKPGAVEPSRLDAAVLAQVTAAVGAQATPATVTASKEPLAEAGGTVNVNAFNNTKSDTSLSSRVDRLETVLLELSDLYKDDRRVRMENARKNRQNDQGKGRGGRGRGGRGRGGGYHQGGQGQQQSDTQQQSKANQQDSSQA